MNATATLFKLKYSNMSVVDQLQHLTTSRRRYLLQLMLPVAECDGEIARRAKLQQISEDEYIHERLTYYATYGGIAAFLETQVAQLLYQQLDSAVA